MCFVFIIFFLLLRSHHIILWRLRIIMLEMHTLPLIFTIIYFWGKPDKVYVKTTDWKLLVEKLHHIIPRPFRVWDKKKLMLQHVKLVAYISIFFQYHHLKKDSRKNFRKVCCCCFLILWLELPAFSYYRNSLNVCFFSIKSVGKVGHTNFLCLGMWAQ